MKKYKYSKYNYKYTSNNHTYIYNTLSGMNAEVNSISNIKLPEKNNIIFSEGLNEQLHSAGILLDSNVNEELLLTQLFYNYENNGELFLIILPTEQCNLRCIYCYEDFKNGIMSTSVQENLLIFLYSILPHYKRLYISWFGGEPLLAVNIIEKLSAEIIKLSVKHQIDFHAGITTNGTLLSSEIFERLLNCRIYDYQITLDGAKETHDKQRINVNHKGTFDVIYRNLLDMKKSDKQFGVILRTNISKETTTSLYNYIDNIKNDFGDDKRFMLHFVAIADLTGTLHTTIDLCDTYCLFQYYKYAKSIGISFDFYKSMFKPTGMICYAANPNAMVIGSDGKIYKCTVAFNNPVNTIGELKNGKALIDYEKKLLWEQNGFETSIKCTTCKFSPICFGKFCPLEKIINKKEPCPPFYKYINTYLQLMHK